MAAMTGILLTEALKAAAVSAAMTTLKHNNVNINQLQADLIATAMQEALNVIGGADPLSGSAAFQMAATTYRNAVQEWNKAKADHPVKE